MSFPFIFTIFLAFCIFITFLSGTTGILLQPEVYLAVITELKLVRNSYICLKSSSYVKLIGITIKNLDHVSGMFC